MGRLRLQEKSGRLKESVDESGLNPEQKWRNWPLIKAPLCSVFYPDGQLGWVGLWSQNYGTWFFPPKTCKELLRNFKQVILAFIKGWTGEPSQEWMREDYWWQIVQLKSWRWDKFKNYLGNEHLRFWLVFDEGSKRKVSRMTFRFFTWVADWTLVPFADMEHRRQRFSRMPISTLLNKFSLW